MLGVACRDSTDPDELTLEVRVQLLESEVEPLNANLSNPGVESPFDKVNTIWQQAGIR